MYTSGENEIYFSKTRRNLRQRRTPSQRPYRIRLYGLGVKMKEMLVDELVALNTKIPFDEIYVSLFSRAYKIGEAVQNVWTGLLPG